MNLTRIRKTGLSQDRSNLNPQGGKNYWSIAFPSHKTGLTTNPVSFASKGSVGVNKKKIGLFYLNKFRMLNFFFFIAFTIIFSEKILFPFCAHEMMLKIEQLCT